MAIRIRCVPVLLTILTAAAGCGPAGGGPSNRLYFAALTGTARGELSPQGQASLSAMIDAGSLADLECPNFTNYRIPAKSFYDSAGRKLVWLRDGQPTNQARQLITVLQHADRKGLNPEDYNGPKWEERVETLPGKNSEPDQIRFDLALTISAMRYASDLHEGRVDPHQLGFGYDTGSKRIDPADFLKRNVVDASDVAAAFDQLEPSFPGYQWAERALDSTKELAEEATELPITKSPLRPGDPYPDLARLIEFLQGTGDLPSDAEVPENSHVYKGAVVEAVKHFQERHGIAATGRIDQGTLRELNPPSSKRADKLELALERWRWIPLGPQPLIIVNVPEFRLYAFDEGYDPVLTMKVLDGKAVTNETPLFGGRMKSVVFRPYWNVPPSIERAELLPKIEANGGSLGNSFQVVDAHSRVVSGGNIVSGLRSGRLAIRQVPGSHNALGLVKFVFPNDYDVYMHDTPAVRLFAKARRDLTHGCIRVEKAAELAEWVLRFNSGWGQEAIHAAMQGNRTIPVNLTNPFSVFIVYMTAMAQENGEVHFFDDIYGHDEALRRALARREACSA